MTLFDLLLFTTLLIISNGNTHGPYYYPTGSNDDPLFITFGQYNSSHFFLNIDIFGEHWFGFGFADTGQQACSSRDDVCFMNGVDAILYGNYGNARTAKLWSLGNHDAGSLHTQQDLSITEQDAIFESAKGSYQYSAHILHPSSALDDTFCWLWAQGNGMNVDGFTQSHLASGHQCVALSDSGHLPENDADAEHLPEPDAPPAHLPQPDEPVHLPEDPPIHLPEDDGPVHLPEHDHPANAPEQRPPRRRPPFSTKNSNRKLKKWSEMIASLCGVKKDSCRKMGWAK